MCLAKGQSQTLPKWNGRVILYVCVHECRHGWVKVLWWCCEIHMYTFLKLVLYNFTHYDDLFWLFVCSCFYVLPMSKLTPSFSVMGWIKNSVICVFAAGGHSQEICQTRRQCVHEAQWDRHCWSGTFCLVSSLPFFHWKKNQFFFIAICKCCSGRTLWFFNTMQSANYSSIYCCWWGLKSWGFRIMVCVSKVAKFLQ